LTEKQKLLDVDGVTIFAGDHFWLKIRGKAHAGVVQGLLKLPDGRVRVIVYFSLRGFGVVRHTYTPRRALRSIKQGIEK
jgi:hypothetical protein